MELNKFVFPAPNPSYTAFTLDRLMWIPRSRFFSFKTLSKNMDTYENTYLESKTCEDLENIQKSSKPPFFLSQCHFFLSIRTQFNF